MMPRDEVQKRRQQAFDRFRDAGIVVTDEERQRIEIADFGLGDFSTVGLAVLVYVNTRRCCAKELAMGPRQTCPEHRHPEVGGRPGKEETFRCRKGTVYLYLPGPRTPSPACRAPQGREGTYTVWHEVRLAAGEQYTLAPNTPHWFQSGDDGCVVSEFSTSNTDEHDAFTDPEINRMAGL